MSHDDAHPQLSPRARAAAEGIPLRSVEIEDDYHRRAEQMGVGVDDLMRKEGWGEDEGSPSELDAILDEQEHEDTARRAVRATHAGLRLPEDDHRRVSVLAEEPRLRHLAELAERRDVADAKLRRAVCFYREFDQDRLSLPKIALAIRSGPSAVRTMYTEGTREQVAQLLDEEATSPRDVGAPLWRPDEAAGDGYYLGTELGTGEPVVVPFGPIAVAARGDHCDRAVDLLSTQTAYAMAPNIVTNSESVRRDLEAVCRYAVGTDDVARRDYGTGSYAATFFRWQIYPARFGTLWGAVTDTFLGDDGRRRPLADYIATTLPDGREVHPKNSELNCGADDYGKIHYVVRMARDGGIPGKWNPDAAPPVVRIERSADDAPPPECMVLVGEVHNRVQEWSKRIPVIIAPRRQADIRWTLCRQGLRDIEFRLATADYSWIPSQERRVQE